MAYWIWCVLLPVPRPTALWAFEFVGLTTMHYFAYLDEFGHIGPFISRCDPKHNTSPIFGFAGIVLPVEAVRNFSMYFCKLKCNLLTWEIEHNSRQVPAYQWEKKGAALYTIKNIEKYSELRQATFRLINKIKAAGGFLFYSGIEKNLRQTNV